MLDPFDQLQRHEQELINQKQMLLTLAASHNKLNEKLHALMSQHEQVITALEDLKTYFKLK
jgi:phage shock protein A